MGIQKKYYFLIINNSKYNELEPTKIICTNNSLYNNGCVILKCYDRLFDRECLSVYDLNNKDRYEENYF